MRPCSFQPNVQTTCSYSFERWGIRVFQCTPNIENTSVTALVRSMRVFTGPQPRQQYEWDWSCHGHASNLSYPGRSL